MSNFSFNSRETYQAYRSDWKQRYEELSRQQRENTKELKDVARKGGFVWTQISTRLSNKRLAHSMIEELALAKKEAAAQWKSKRIVSS